MFAMILVSGIQSLTRKPLTERDGLIVALAIGLGVGIGNVPAVLAQLPSWVGNIFAQNGIIMTFVIATVSVSYTHLDVYKRQGYRNGRWYVAYHGT